MGKVIPVSQTESFEKKKVRFTGISSDGLCLSPSKPEVYILPDWSKIVMIPWRENTYWCISSLRNSSGPHIGCTRSILQRVLERSRNQKIEFKIGYEIELYLVTEQVDKSISTIYSTNSSIPAYSYDRIMNCSGFWRKVHDYSVQCGIPIIAITHEGGEGQVEFSLDYSDPLSSADSFMLFKVLVKQVAKELGIIATFMPKPFFNDLGSSSHMNISSIDMDEVTLGYMLSGILKFIDEIIISSCATVNSFKRFKDYHNKLEITWTTDKISIGIDDRTAMIRIVPLDNRIEFRAVDGLANPYFSLSTVLSACLYGVENKLSIIKYDDICKSDVDLYEYNGKTIPDNLFDAICKVQDSHFLKEVLGVGLFDEFIAIKRKEWSEYMAEVHQWEINRYLKK